MRLNQYLVENKQSAAAFAKEMGVTSVAVWKWVNGKSLPSGANMARIDRITDGHVTSIDWISDGQESA